MPDEIYLPVVGYEGSYEVSNLGNVKALRGHKRGERVLKTYLSRHGYLLVHPCTNGVSRGKRVHRLVAEAFIPNPDNLPQVNHINGIKTDNSVGNLEWVTASENMTHAVSLGLISRKRLPFCGRGHDMSKTERFSPKRNKRYCGECSRINNKLATRRNINE